MSERMHAISMKLKNTNVFLVLWTRFVRPPHALNACYNGFSTIKWQERLWCNG